MLSTSLVALILSQGIPVKGGSSADLATVNSEGQLSVRAFGLDGGANTLYDVNGFGIHFADDGRVDISQDQPFFRDVFSGATLAVHNKWAQSALTQTITVGAGAVTLNASAITTINTYSNLISPQKLRGFLDGAIFVRVRARPNNLPQTNALAEIGLGNALTNVAPTDGMFFRWTASGGFECVVNRGGSETSVAMTAPESGVYSLFSINSTASQIECQYETPSTNAHQRAVMQLASAAPSVFVESPGAMLRLVNGAVAPALAPQLIVGAISTGVKTLALNRPSAVVGATGGQSTAYTPLTGLQAPNHANSTSPVSATLSNTAAGYATLGGRYQFAAPVGAATDFALFGFQVPASYRLVVTGIAISTCNTGAAVATTATLLDWGVAVGSTAVSLATADAVAATPTSAPRRVPLGMQGFIIGAAIGQCVPDIVRDFTGGPLTVESGRFLHVVLQVPVGTATAAQVIRGDVTVTGYFEQ